MLKAVAKTHEPTQGVVLDAMAALEKNQPMGFDYREVSMPVHVFHGRTDHMVRGGRTVSALVSRVRFEATPSKNYMHNLPRLWRTETDLIWVESKKRAL